MNRTAVERSNVFFACVPRCCCPSSVASTCCLLYVSHGWGRWHRFNQGGPRWYKGCRQTQTDNISIPAGGGAKANNTSPLWMSVSPLWTERRKEKRKRETRENHVRSISAKSQVMMSRQHRLCLWRTSISRRHELVMPPLYGETGSRLASGATAVHLLFCFWPVCYTNKFFWFWLDWITQYLQLIEGGLYGYIFISSHHWNFFFIFYSV